MNIDDLENNSIPLKKIYKDKGITCATYLGGPLVAGYLIAENFKVFKEKEKVKITWVITIIFTVVLFTTVVLLPDSIHVPNYIIPIIYTGAAHFLITRYQGEKINSHIANGGLTYSGWRIALISLIGLVVTVAPFVFSALIYDGATNFNIDTKTYGPTQNEITYEKSLTVVEVDKMADALFSTGFFDDAEKKYVYERKVGNDYELRIGIEPNRVNEDGFKQAFKGFRDDLQTLFPNNKIVILLIGETVDDILARIE